MPQKVESSPQRGGGLFARGTPGTWINVAVGLGMAGPVKAPLIDELIDWHTRHTAEPRVELCPYADPTLVAVLAERGFVPRLFENVFFRELSIGDECASPFPVGPGIVIGEIDPSDNHDVHACALVIASAFAGDQPPTDAALDLAKRCITHPRSITLAARSHGRVVGAGSMELLGTQAALFGLCVAPDFRRRGIQLALISDRLKLAAQRGATIATISARPGVSTEGNSRRMGFQVAYTKVVLVRPGVGLLPALG